MYFKIPLKTDLTETSCRASKEVGGFLYIDYNSGFVGEEWEVVNKEKMREIASEWFDRKPKTQLDIIQAAVEKSNEELRQEGAAVATAAFKPFGAGMTFALAAASLDVPPTAGAFAEEWEEWQADGKTAAAKSLWKYNGIGYQARTEVQKIEAYAPDQAVNNYAVRPIPDSRGIFPTVLNMDVEIGMKLLDGEDGRVYECYANPITSLQWQPREMPASFRLWE